MHLAHNSRPYVIALPILLSLPFFGVIEWYSFLSFICISLFCFLFFISNFCIPFYHFFLLSLPLSKKISFYIIIFPPFHFLSTFPSFFFSFSLHLSIFLCSNYDDLDQIKTTLDLSIYTRIPLVIQES